MLDLTYVDMIRYVDAVEVIGCALFADSRDDQVPVPSPGHLHAGSACLLHQWLLLRCSRVPVLPFAGCSGKEKN